MLVSARTGEGVDAFARWLADVSLRGRGVSGVAQDAGPSEAHASGARCGELLELRTEAGERFFAAERRAPGATVSPRWPSASRAAGA